jgi:mannan endo-1,4-beta-mannosidase
VQYGSQCFCGDSYGKYNRNSGCDMPCTANANEICGGSWRNNIYHADGATVPPPNPPPPSGGGLAPADANANAKTRSVLAYLVDLPKQGGKRVLSGQLIGRHTNDVDWNPIIQESGHAPAIMGVSVNCWTADSACINYQQGLGTFSVDMGTMTNHWNSGGLITVSQNTDNPKTRDQSSTFSSSDYDSLVNPARWPNPVHDYFINGLDLLANQYLVLQNAGVVLFHRPFHEMNGGWDWYGNGHGSPDQYKQLWIMEFDYLTKTKGVHNLLFVYGPSGGAGNYGTYYPGDQYVDIVGLSHYPNVVNGQPVSKPGGYDELTTQVAPSKPFAFTEFGPSPPNTTNAQFTPKDYNMLIDGIRQSMPRVVYWHSWIGLFSMGVGITGPGGQHNLNVPQLLADPWVVNRGDVHF